MKITKEQKIKEMAINIMLRFNLLSIKYGYYLVINDNGGNKNVYTRCNKRRYLDRGTGCLY